MRPALQWSLEADLRSLCAHCCTKKQHQNPPPCMVWLLTDSITKVKADWLSQPAPRPKLRRVIERLHNA